MSVASGTERVEAWRPTLPGVAEVFHARFLGHRYPPHTHDAWTVLVVDQGAIRYDLDGHHHGSGPDVITVLPPHVVHDGRAASDAGFRKRVLYLDVGLLGESLIGAAVDTPCHHDPALRPALDALHRSLASQDDLLAGEAQLAVVVERLEANLLHRPLDPPPADPALADSVRQLLDARVFEPVTLAEVGEEVGANPTHLVRSFSRAFGISPHAYVISRRIDEARRRLLDGEPGARVASDLGFHDQAHLSRHFKRHVGVSPGRFVRPGQA